MSAALGQLRTVPAPRPRARHAGSLQAARGTVALGYGAAIAFAALISASPLMLGALLAAVILAGALAGVGRSLRRASRLAIPVVVLSVLVNGLVSHQGLTVLARLGDWGVLGQVDVTLQAIVYGLVFALRLLVVSLAFVLVAATADADGLLRSCRRISPRLGLTIAVATRLLFVLGGDARRLAEAQRCRALAPAPGARARLAVLRASVAGSLERSLEVAAVLEMRGYAAGRRAPALRRARSRHDLAFAAAAVALAALALVVDITGLAGFATYPAVELDSASGAILASAGMFVLALAPFMQRRGVDR